MASTKSLVILGLLAVVWWLSSAVIRLEKYHHASQVGFCYEPVDYTKDPLAQARRVMCLDKQETRTHAMWHLVYGLKVL